MGTGERKAMDAVEHAIESPPRDLARGCPLDPALRHRRTRPVEEVSEAAKAVAEAAHPEANIIFGAMVDEKVEDQVWVTVVATGYGDRPLPRAPRREHTIPADAEPRVRRTRERERSERRC